MAVLAWRRVRKMEGLTWQPVLPSAVFGLLYWGVPIVLFITVDRMLGI